jgi:hypothetical protein
MKRVVVIGLVALCATYCSSGEVELGISTTTLFGSNVQGPELHGFTFHDEDTETTMLGFQFSGATLNGSPLSNLRVEQGELVAEQSSVTLRGDDLEHAELVAQVKNLASNPPMIQLVAFRIQKVVEEDGTYDPTGTGGTFLYTLHENHNGNGFKPACSKDENNDRVAIPLTDVYDEHGDRINSSTLFTFGCTNGSIGKCYRWGYRPWVTGYGDLETMHWTCTRLARADYCGDGTPHTFEGTTINVWDNLSAQGPIQAHQTTPSGMVFEAGWNTGGAVCLSHLRWESDGGEIALDCPGRLIPPGPPPSSGSTTCDSDTEAEDPDFSALMFTESHVNQQ